MGKPLTMPGLVVGEQDAGARKEFFESGFEKCNQCGALDVGKEDVEAGVTDAGKAFGTSVFTCGACGWQTSFFYNYSRPPYYYETKAYMKEAWDPKRNSGSAGGAEAGVLRGFGVSALKRRLAAHGIGAAVLRAVEEQLVDGATLAGAGQADFLGWGLGEGDTAALVEARGKILDGISPPAPAAAPARTGSAPPPPPPPPPPPRA